MIGSLLVDAVQLSSGIIEIIKADKEIWDKKTKRRKTVDEKILSLTDDASESLRIANETLDGLSSRFGPMTSPPIQYPTTIGPYLDARTAFQVPMVKKVWNPDHQKAIDTAVASGQMDGPLRAINRVMVTPYTINEWVLEAVKWVKKEKSGIDLEKFPVLDELPVPERKSDVEFKQLSKDQQIAYAQSIKEAKKSNLEARASLRVVGGSITDAEELVGMCFFLPHQFDKRGRIYHTSNFGHHNADWMRGLIVFWNKGKITKDNVKYLELALANAWGNGVDKESFVKRQKWVTDNRAKILRCGNNYQASFPFWSQADDPFQFMAACRDYYLWDTNGDGHETGLPIGLDATNSGYQHYAAASLNRKDGVKVNLTESSPDKAPEDLYVACMLEAQRLTFSKSVQERAHVKTSTLSSQHHLGSRWSSSTVNPTNESSSVCT
jgi:DNA-directed RNA polymerase